jgi:nucleoid DNA-binding protein
VKPTENGRTQKELARELSEELGLTEHKAMRFIRLLLQCVGDDLVEKGHVELRGLGTFEAVPRPAQTIKHPVTGKPIKVPAYRTIRFRASKGLRERLMPDPPPKKRKRKS